MNGNNNEKMENGKLDNLKSDDENDGRYAPPCKTQKKHSIPVTDQANPTKKERSKSLADPSQLQQFDPIKDRVASILSVSDFGLKVTRKTTESAKSGVCQKIVDFLNLTFLKDSIYVNIAIGVSCGLFSDNMFTSILPMYLKSLGFSMDEAALIVSAGTAFDLLSRVMIAILSIFVTFKSRTFFLIGLTALVFGRFVLLYVDSFYTMLVIMAFIGFVRTSLHIPMSLIFAEYLPADRYVNFFRFKWKC